MAAYTMRHCLTVLAGNQSVASPLISAGATAAAGLLADIVEAETRQ